jgi:hypothetical protein
MRLVLSLLLASIVSAHAQTVAPPAVPPIVRAIQQLAPGAGWTLSGTDCSGLQWDAGNIQSKPTCAAINAVIAALPAANVPLEVSVMGAKVALSRAGLLPAVQAWVSTQSAERQLIWNTATTFRRDSALIAAGAAALGLTSAQLDQLFITAATVNP